MKNQSGKMVASQEKVANKLREKIRTYAVDITELFQKTVLVKATNGDDAVKIIRNRYFADELRLTVDSDFVDSAKICRAETTILWKFCADRAPA